MSGARRAQGGARETQPNRAGPGPCRGVGAGPPRRGRRRPRTRLQRGSRPRAPVPSLGTQLEQDPRRTGAIPYPSPGSQRGATWSPILRRDFQDFPTPTRWAWGARGPPSFPGDLQLAVSLRMSPDLGAMGCPWGSLGDSLHHLARAGSLPDPAAPPLPFLLFPSSERLLALPVGCWLRFRAGKPGPPDSW